MASPHSFGAHELWRLVPDAVEPVTKRARGAAEWMMTVLDRARQSALRLSCPLPLVAALLRSRALRLRTVALTQVVGAAMIAVCCPLLLLAVGPLVWGVPHLVSDVRSLVVRRPLLRGASLSLVLVLLAVSAVLLVVRPGLGLSVGMAAMIPAALGARRLWSKLVLALTAAILVLLSSREPSMTAFVLLHGHNVVAIGLAVAAAGASRRHLIVPLLVASLVVLMVGCGLFDAPVVGLPMVGDVPLAREAELLAPLDAEHTRRWVISFAFLQSIHYAAWITWVPDAERPGERPHSYVRSLRELTADLGWPLVLLSFLMMVGLFFASFVSLSGARGAYFVIAGSHGFLELAAATAWLGNLGSARVALSAKARA